MNSFTSIAVGIMERAVLSFPKGGVHPKEFKELTEHLPIEVFPVPEEVEIPLSQHFGAVCMCVRKAREEVREGDIIGEVKEGLGANIHASISGTIKRIATSPHPVMVNVPSVVIKGTEGVDEIEYKEEDWEGLPKEELLKRVKEAGIVGLGGAGFPTHVKLSPPREANIDLLILNGAECEPYLTTDHRVMLEHAREIIEGARIIMKILGVSKCMIGIEANKEDAIEEMDRCIRDLSLKDEITVHPLKVKYPQGSEKQLIQSLTGRKVPGFGLPFDVGVVVQNVGTTFAIYEAVCMNKPLYERVITVSGNGIKRQANLKVRIGTRLSDIVDYLGGTTPELARVVIGGPMMGFAISTFDIPVTKTTSGFLFLTEKEIDTNPYSQCIRCGWCLDACPMGVAPNEIGIYVEAGRAEDTAEFGLFECFECGSCAFVCPAKRPLVQFIRIAKQKARKN